MESHKWKDQIFGDFVGYQIRETNDSLARWMGSFLMKFSRTVQESAHIQFTEPIRHLLNTYATHKAPSSALVGWMWHKLKYGRIRALYG